MNMKMTEKNILREIARLLAELDVATYGDDNHRCRTIPPSVSRFHLCTTQIFKLIDELVANYQPDYISNSDYYYICDCERSIKLELDVLKDNKRLHGQQLTWALEPYWEKLQSQLRGMVDIDAYSSLLKE